MTACQTLGPRFVGDPVDVVTGEVWDVATDFRIAGERGLAWNRWYRTGRGAHADHGLGLGHRHAFDWTIRVDVDGIRVEAPDRPISFAHLWSDGDSATSQGWRLLRSAKGRFSLQRAGEPERHFQDGRLVELHHNDGGQTLLQYHGNNLIAVQDTEGWRLSLTWRGGLLRSVTASGVCTPFAAITYGYDETRRLLVEGRDAYGHSFGWSYDAAARVTKRTDRRGHAFVFAYDGQGRCVRAAGEDDVDAVILEYADNGRETKVIHEANGATWWYRYQPAAELLEIEDPYGNCRSFQYAADGTKLGEFDGAGHAWTYDLDSVGAKIGLRDPLGDLHAPSVEPTSLSGVPHPTPATEYQQEHGAALSLGFDVEGGSTLGAGLPQALASTLIGAEHAGQTRSVFDVQGLHLRTDRSFPGSALTQSRRFAYDANGNIRKYVDFDGAKWSYEYASWNQRVALVDPLGGRTAVSYNARDRVAAVVDAGGTRTDCTWNLSDRLASIQRHGKTRERYTYDGAGGLLEKRGPDGEVRVSYARGPMGTLLARTTCDGVEETLKRDDGGRILEATNTDTTGKRTLRRTYSTGGCKTREACNGAGFDHAYAAGRRISTAFQTATGTKFVTQYRHRLDGTTEVVDPTGGVHTIGKIGAGVRQRTFANGTREVSQHDGEGRCLAKASDGSAGLWRRRFVRTGEGDLAYREDDRRGKTEFTWDAAHRLVEARDASGRTDRYTHDAAGNLLHKPGLGDPGAVDGEPDDLRVATGVALANGNRIAYANGDRFHYDPQDHICLRERAGNVLEYVHDALGRLRKVLRGGELRWAADYDALGRRTAKRRYDEDGACASWAFCWDGDRLGAETLPDGRLRIYVYAEDSALVPMLALEYASAESDAKSARVFVLQSDHRGAVERIEDEDGQVVWEATVGPYGEVDVHLGWDFHQPFVLVGQYADPEIGLSYQRFRYWSPELGRFLQSDPLGLAGGLNVYAWPGCPLVTSDPLGLGCPKGGKNNDGPDETGPDQESLDLDRRDRAALAAHFDAVDAHDAKYRKKEAAALAEGDIYGARGHRGKATEAHGERSSAAYMERESGPGGKYDGARMERGFSEGQGYDQVWVKRDPPNDPNGTPLEINIVEAKGRNEKSGRPAGLGDSKDGPQMSDSWVEAKAEKMAKSNDPKEAALGKEILQGIEDGPPPIIRGRQVTAEDPRPPGPSGRPRKGVEDKPPSTHPSGDYNE